MWTVTTLLASIGYRFGVGPEAKMPMHNTRYLDVRKLKKS
jgi:hypothetical protein